MELGADYVEMDIRFTKDDVPVISHDSTALRMFGDPSKISDLPLKEFLLLRYRQDPRYTAKRLSDVFLSGVSPILFHIKEGGDRLPSILDCIEEYEYQDRVVLGVVSAKDIRTVKVRDPRMRVLAFSSSKEALPEFANDGADILRYWEPWVTREDVEAMHAIGKKAWVMAGRPSEDIVGYTDDRKLVDLARMGVDGILINEISNAKRVLGL